MQSVTALYGGLTILLFAGLSMNVSRLRGKFKTAVGDNSDPSVLRASRAQGNCAEYLAILFLAMFLAETTDASKTFLHILGGCIFISRSAHAYGLLAQKFAAQIVGSAINYLLLLILPLYVLFLYFT